MIDENALLWQIYRKRDEIKSALHIETQVGAPLMKNATNYGTIRKYMKINTEVR